ncbi:mannose-P-dolichol utilization defect 1 protein-like [Ruditapes philippinarum]|uniref:mannose-P-dolichol utilization defect 1 protein-like n=1 Tax=Ruditapes philippinarum TaxID=129788 RepID=UPI00295AFF77|nr:mannose-P-dolichol utilization defect 1 protein-like [Ruditapes philippinarum]
MEYTTHTQGPCMLSVFSKTLGYVLIGTMTVSLIPQIVKILRKRSASGVSFVSILLTLEASSATVAYAIQKRFPVSAWGENIVLMHMNVVLICLLLRYNNKLKTSITFLAIYILFMLLTAVANCSQSACMGPISIKHACNCCKQVNTNV